MWCMKEEIRYANLGGNVGNTSAHLIKGCPVVLEGECYVLAYSQSDELGIGILKDGSNLLG